MYIYIIYHIYIFYIFYVYIKCMNDIGAYLYILYIHLSLSQTDN